MLFTFFFFISLYGEKAIFRHHSQAVRQRSAKPLFPSSILGGASKTKSTSYEVLFVLERCVPLTRNVMRTSCVMLPLAVMCASRVSKEHITSLCAKGAIHHYGEAMASLRRSRYITFYKRSKLCYNITESEVLLWQSQNYANYQWSFPLIS